MYLIIPASSYYVTDPKLVTKFCPIFEEQLCDMCIFICESVTNLVSYVNSRLHIFFAYYDYY